METKHKCEKSKSVLKPKEARGYVMQRICNYCNKVMDADAPISTFEGLIRAYIHGKNKRRNKIRRYKIIDDGKRLIYEGTGRNIGLGIDVLALKLKDGRIIGNASRLERCGSYRRGTEAPAQRVMFNLNMAMIPFNVFDEANLDIQKAKVIEQGIEEDFDMPKMEWDEREAVMNPVDVRNTNYQKNKFVSDDKIKVMKQWKHTFEENVKTKSGSLKSKKGRFVYRNVNGWECEYIDLSLLENRHFVGAMLLSVGKKYFLFDVDRKELNYYRFNPFLVQLPNKVTTITEAYESLKPKEVVKAEKDKLKVQRQGEWFFIPTKLNKIPKIPKLPLKISNGLKYEPESEQYNLDSLDVEFEIGENSEQTKIINLKEVKRYCNTLEVKKKYRANIISRARDMNIEILKYKQFQKQKEEFESQFNFYKYGGELQTGVTRPNKVEKLFIFKGINYVKGNVEHTGREHEPMRLEQWHIAVPNTAVNSFTIVGDID